MTEKNMGKKLLTWTLALSMTIAPVGAFAEDGAEGQSANQTGVSDRMDTDGIAVLPARTQDAPAVFTESSAEGITDNVGKEKEENGTIGEEKTEDTVSDSDNTDNGGESTVIKEGESAGTHFTTFEGEVENNTPIATPAEEVTYAATIGETKYDTLRDAITAANDGDTIVLAKNVTENIKIDKSITLDLNKKTLSGNGTDTVVKISAKTDAEVTVQNGTVTGGNSTTYGGGFDIRSGKITIENCRIENNTARSSGGGVYITGSANVEIIDCKINNNTATYSSGGAIYQASGAVYNIYYNNSCKIVDTELRNNRAVVGGAVGMGASHYHDGITNADGGKGVTATFTMEGESVMDGNTASNYGGAVYLSGNGSRFLMKDGTISNNTTTKYEGGGIWAANYGGVTIEKGTIRDNTAKGNGGAIYMKANISDTNSSAKLAVENGINDCLNLGTALVTGNEAKQGGGICIDSYATAYGIKADLTQASIYDNHASVRGDDIYSTGAGTKGCTVQLGEFSTDWELSCGDKDTVDGWYIDGDVMGEGTARWNAHPLKGEIYTQLYEPRENLTGALTLKAAHARLYLLTIHYKYKDGSKAAEDFVAEYDEGTPYNIVSPVINRYKVDKAEVSGEMPAENVEVTVTYWKKSGGGGGEPIEPKPEKEPTVEIPDDDALGLNDTDHFAYIVGYGHNDVRPLNSITRAEVAAIFFRLLEDGVRSENFTHQNDFSDVAADGWYCSSVSTLSRMGIIAGYPDGTFRPNAPITRAEFAAIATRFDNNGDKTPVDFKDIAGHWAEGEITVAANHGWVSGYGDGTFRPENKITRAETMSLVNRVLKRIPETPEDLLSNMIIWTDNADTSVWYYLPVQEATNSHYYEFKENSKYEKWTELRETRDWSELG